jgi:hypothetical protein
MSKLHKFVAVMALFLYLVGCGGGGGDSQDDETQIPASQFSGTYTTPSDQGTFNFTVTSPKPANAAARSTLSANVNSANFGNLVVPGNFEPEFNFLRFDSPSGANPFVQILGSFEGNQLVGFTAGAIGNGSATAIPDEGNTATTFCGAFSRNSAQPGGSFNLVIVNNIAAAAVHDDLDFANTVYGGSVTGTTVNLSDGDGTVAVGTVAGMGISGTWTSDLPESGNWTGSIAACP